MENNGSTFIMNNQVFGQYPNGYDMMTPLFDLKKHMYHITSLRPDEFLNGKIERRENTTITGEKVNAIFASDSDEISAYAARNPAFGMFKLGNMVIYNNDNIEHKDGKLLLKNDLYRYELPETGFRKVQLGGNFEYIKTDADIDVKNLKYEKINDVTSLTDKHQVFSDVSGRNVGCKLVDCYQQNGVEAAKNMLIDMINNGDVIYHNEYVGNCVVSDFLKRKDGAKRIGHERKVGDPEKVMKMSQEIRQNSNDFGKDLGE